MLDIARRGDLVSLQINAECLTRQPFDRCSPAVSIFSAARERGQIHILDWLCLRFGDEVAPTAKSSKTFLHFLQKRMYGAQQWYLDRFGFPQQVNGEFLMVLGLSNDVTAFRRYRDLVCPDVRAACTDRFITRVLHRGDITILQTEYVADTVKSCVSRAAFKYAPQKRRNHRWFAAFCRRHGIPLHVRSSGNRKFKRFET